MKTTFPDVNALSMNQCRLALTMAVLNWRGMNGYQIEATAPRMQAIRDRLRRLEASARRIKSIEVAK